jgi:RHS repeat-associated protein
VYGTDEITDQRLPSNRAAATGQASVLYGPYCGIGYSNRTMPGSYGFTGQRTDTTTGLDYYNARYYDARAGQFASADSVAAGGLNRYGYVVGNPETMTDPSGHCVQTDVQGGGSLGCGGGCSTNCQPPTPPCTSNSSGGGGGGGGGGSCGGSCHNPAVRKNNKGCFDWLNWYIDANSARETALGDLRHSAAPWIFGGMAGDVAASWVRLFGERLSGRP